MNQIKTGSKFIVYRARSAGKRLLRVTIGYDFNSSENCRLSLKYKTRQDTIY